MLALGKELAAKASNASPTHWRNQLFLVEWGDKKPA